MSEKNSAPVVAAAGTEPVAKPAATVAAGGAAKVAPAPVVQPPVASAQPPALFGGHRGGGKKRADGLVAGSPEAIAADKEKNRLRMAAKRAGEKVATLPPALPGATAPAANAPAPVVAVDGAVVPAVADVGSGQTLFPTFVAWKNTMLERPVKLLTKIIDRFRCSKLMERVRKLGFDKETEAEAEKRIAYKAEQIADFNTALTNCALVELNKRNVPGAQHSHWLELAMTGGELVNCHLDTVDWLEKKILEKAERENPAATEKKS